MLEMFLAKKPYTVRKILARKENIAWRTVGGSQTYQFKNQQ